MKPGSGLCSLTNDDILGIVLLFYFNVLLLPVLTNQFGRIINYKVIISFLLQRLSFQSNIDRTIEL